MFFATEKEEFTSPGTNSRLHIAFFRKRIFYPFFAGELERLLQIKKLINVVNDLA